MSLEDQFMTMEVADNDTMSSAGFMTNRSTKSGSSMEERQRQRLRKLEKDKKEAKEVNCGDKRDRNKAR